MDPSAPTASAGLDRWTAVLLSLLSLPLLSRHSMALFLLLLLLLLLLTLLIAVSVE